MTRGTATAPDRTTRSASTHTVAVAGLAVTIGAQIVYPLVHGSNRDITTMVVLCAGVVAMAADAIGRRGALRGAVVIVAIAVLAFAFEVVGTRTGIPFGDYTYAQDRIGPSIATVPILISAAWFVGAYSVWRVAVFVLPRRPVLRVLAAIVALVGWDLYLDPQMVAAGLWRWGVDDAGLPGIEQIPLTNYAGWALLGLVVFAVLTALDAPARTGVPHADDTTARVPVIPLTWFVWTWLGSAVAQVFFLEDGALRSGIAYGLVAMAVLGVPALAAATGCRR
ncbi:carotenoid biosynthesis protein [Williamsia phyllosphaerae]|uniref:Membrane protein n=1 Tax=Williamsia phyllosphaerae TaxID=885042 RepID=A0ABQ1UZU4_9NOCA|nr:carotenoid biosynthesis protein [Williamsia phyllosphaerae]GGF29422.1 membrane protein [Williamsia phyllosphaerae]